jgi:hypothetical protein
MIKLPPEFGHFGRHHYAAIALSRIVDIIILMIIFSYVKLVNGFHLRHDWIIPDVGVV